MRGRPARRVAFSFATAKFDRIAIGVREPEPGTSVSLPKGFVHIDLIVVSKILYLRQHYNFGPGKIADYLKRFHSLSVAGSSVHRILGETRHEPAAGQS